MKHTRLAGAIFGERLGALWWTIFFQTYLKLALRTRFRGKRKVQPAPPKVCVLVIVFVFSLFFYFFFNGVMPKFCLNRTF